MTKVIQASNLQDFISEVTQAFKEGKRLSMNVKAVGNGVSHRSRSTVFDVVTKECGKVYEVKGLSGLLATLNEMISEGREVRSVIPVGIFKERVLTASYSTEVLTNEVKPDSEVIDQWKSFMSAMDAYRTATSVEPVKDLKDLTKKELLELCKEKGLNGNIQESKATMIKRIKQSEKGEK